MVKRNVALSMVATASHPSPIWSLSVSFGHTYSDVTIIIYFCILMRPLSLPLFLKLTPVIRFAPSQRLLFWWFTHLVAPWFSLRGTSRSGGFARVQGPATTRQPAWTSLLLCPTEENEEFESTLLSYVRHRKAHEAERVHVLVILHTSSQSTTQSYCAFLDNAGNIGCECVLSHELVWPRSQNPLLSCWPAKDLCSGDKTCWWREQWLQSKSS